MKDVIFNVAGKDYKCTIPEKWSEITQDQFVIFVNNLKSKKDGIALDTVEQIIGIDIVVAVSLSPSDWWWLRKELEWMLDVNSIDRLVIDELTLENGATLYGYSGDFSDVSFEEWIFADTYAELQRWDIVAAVLYRPERDGWNHECDRRIPFSKYGADARSKMTAKLDPAILKAIRMNYLLLRRRMTKKHRRLFHESEVGNGTDRGKTRKNTTGWLSLIRNVMGDNFYEEEKYMQLSVPSVFFQLERMIKENNERKRHGNAN